jgi:hypothetical protein
LVGVCDSAVMPSSRSPRCCTSATTSSRTRISRLRCRGFARSPGANISWCLPMLWRRRQRLRRQRWQATAVTRTRTRTCRWLIDEWRVGQYISAYNKSYAVLARLHRRAVRGSPSACATDHHASLCVPDACPGSGSQCAGGVAAADNISAARGAPPGLVASTRAAAPASSHCPSARWLHVRRANEVASASLGAIMCSGIPLVLGAPSSTVLRMLLHLGARFGPSR